MSLFATGIVRIISEPQLRTFDNGTQVANLFGGIGEGKDKNGEYINNGIDCEIWGKSAELVCDKCRKGDISMVFDVRKAVALMPRHAMRGFALMLSSVQCACFILSITE